MFSTRCVPSAFRFLFVISALLCGCNSDSTRPGADFHLEPDTLDFGEAYLGISDTLDFWIHNDASRDLPLRLKLDSAEFALITGVGTAEFTLPQGRSTQVLVVCSPLAPGSKGAVIFVEGEDRRIVTCLAQAESHGCVVSPVVLDFGPVSIHAGKVLGFTVWNTAPELLTGRLPDTSHIDRWGERHGPFTLHDSNMPFTLAQGESLGVTVLFRPAELKAYSWTFSLGPDICDSVTCKGEGVRDFP